MKHPREGRTAGGRKTALFTAAVIVLVGSHIGSGGQAPAQPKPPAQGGPGTQTGVPPAESADPGGVASPGQAARAQQRRAGGFGGSGRLYPAADAQSVERGHTQFVTTCAFCHGSNAKGGETGPDLLRSDLVLDDEHGDKIGPVILNGRPNKGMPKFNLSQEQIADISAFLLDRVKAAANRGTYQILNIVTGNPRAGEAYFNGAGGCSGCHSVTGDLAHIGTKYDPVTLQQKIVMPQERGNPNEHTPEQGKPIIAKVTLATGEVVQGKLDRIDDFNVSLMQSDGEYRSFSRDGASPKVEIDNPAKVHTELLGKYTDADIHNLTAYLVNVK